MNMYKNMNEIINKNNEMKNMYLNMNELECISENEWHVYKYVSEYE